MFKLIGKLPLVYKFCLVVSAPVIALVVVSWSLLAEVQKQRAETDRFQALANVALHSSALVHELQKERGASAGFLGSQGKKFGSTLIDQRRLTDKKLSEFNAAESTIQPEDYSPEFAANHIQLKQLLSELRSWRSSVSSQQLTVGQAVGNYTSLNATLLAISDSLAKFGSNGAIANSSAAYATFLQSKERAGIERAVLSSVFAVDAFTTESYAKVSNLINTQNIYLSIFKTMANDQEWDYYTQQMNHPAVAKVESMRSIAFDNVASGNFGVDPEVWFATITQKIGQLLAVEKYLGTNLHTHALDLYDTASTRYTQAIVFVTSAVVLSIFFLTLITITMRKSLSQAMALAQNISKGDLTQKYETSSNDEVGCLLSSLGQMQKELVRVLTKSVEVAASVSQGSQVISQNSSQLLERTDQQSGSLSQTASSTEEISSTIKRNAEFAYDANRLADEASREARHGGEVVGNAIDAMKAINTSSKKIASITTVIDEIAFQTNLLALNAAVEAARAGEQGRGFAVVAAEVRSLAGRSAEAAKEIKELIDDSVNKIQSGAQFVDESGAALEKIVGSVSHVNEIISDIAKASHEQSIGVDIINKSMLEMNAITQDNTTIAQVASNSGRDMYNQSQDLDQQLAFFKLANNR